MIDIPSWVGWLWFSLFIVVVSSLVIRASAAEVGKRCTFCKEEINADATRCKHCHADLAEELKS